MKRRTVVLAAATFLVGCGGAPPPPGIAPPGPSTMASQLAQEREILESADMKVAVEDPTLAADRALSLLADVGGQVASQRANVGDRVDLVLRVPSGSLRPLLTDFRALGDVRHENVQAVDVTEITTELEARIGNLTAVRDRLRNYLSEAEGLSDMMAVEAELVRVQTEIDTLSARLTRIRGQVAMSELDLTIEKRRRLGPIGALGSGTAWFLKKLFVLD